MARALITGISGQDGSYLAELLLSKGYEVFGIIRRASHENLVRIQNIKQSITLIYGDMNDSNSIKNAIQESRPNEIYNLAAMSFVPTSWIQPELTFEVNTNGLLKLIQFSEPYNSKIYQASTSEMYGNSYPEFKPLSPYGVSKLAAHNMANIYRLAGRYITCGICFNHESPRRGNEFVTKKITNFFKNPEGHLRLGNIYASRDWGFAGDYVNAMWLMMQQDKPDDYEIATGETHSVKEFLDLTCPSWAEYVKIDVNLFRPNEINVLKGDPSKIKSIGWENKTSFKELVRMMNE